MGSRVWENKEPGNLFDGCLTGMQCDMLIDAVLNAQLSFGSTAPRGIFHDFPVASPAASLLVLVLVLALLASRARLFGLRCRLLGGAAPLAASRCTLRLTYSDPESSSPSGSSIPRKHNVDDMLVPGGTALSEDFRGMPVTDSLLGHTDAYIRTHDIHTDINARTRTHTHKRTHTDS